MRYSNKQYASSVLEVLKGQGERGSQEILKKFFGLLQRNGDWAKRREILKEIERTYLKSQGIHKVEVETVEGAPRGLKAEIEGSLGKNIVLEEKENSAMLGGIKILIDEEVLIDASARTQLNKMFEKA